MGFSASQRVTGESFASGGTRQPATVNASPRTPLSHTAAITNNERHVRDLFAPIFIIFSSGNPGERKKISSGPIKPLAGGRGYAPDPPY